MSLGASFGDLEALEKEMFDDYNGEGRRYKTFEDYAYEELDAELIEREWKREND